jgi:hypothetical protein
MSRKRLAFLLFLPIFLIGSDFAARFWLLVNTPATVPQFRISRPAPYAHSPYFSAAFADEQGRFAGDWHLDDDGFWKSNFHGQWYNHDGLIRRTTNTPKNSAHTLYLFGSSTTLNIEVPDGYTIASYLQRLVGDRYRVVNLGSSGMRAQTQYRLLTTLKLKEGDAVVFYDGITDAAGSLKLPSDQRDVWLSGKLCNVLTKPVGSLGVVQMYCSLVDRSLPAFEQHPDLRRLREEYSAGLRNARRYTEAHGAVFYHFLQPHIWSQEPTAYEQTVLANYNLVPRGFQEYLAESWPVVQDITRATGGYDLTHCLDALRRKGVEIYLDYDHTTERGNEAVAYAIFDRITIF